ncbi:MAG: aminotransferase class V-fold PLP-dependent enzyme [Clostridia bacterium]|nr:aminotransferase class V-fold PLP-dependent enzyme [Clostridia bacterium]
MLTPIADFVRSYAASDTARLHMPGHKGQSFLGCEPFDITEVHGADALYEADGIILQSEENAARLFGTQRTLYSTEGSSQCIRAMLHLCITLRNSSQSRVIVAARNVHKAFVYAAALIDFDIVWLWPEKTDSLCACPVSAQTLESTLKSLPQPPAAVYLTSPDYLGNLQDIGALADICHAHGTLLAVDNAHGAYLHFLHNPLHPIDLGADICCDSAHKTLPVLTGGAYLHLSNRLPAIYAQQAKHAMAIYGSTSPSYLTLASLDLCNAYLARDYQPALQKAIDNIDVLCEQLQSCGWQLSHGEPLKITLHASRCGISGQQLADRLRAAKVECEYADPDDLVLMLTPQNTAEDFARVLSAVGQSGGAALIRPALSLPKGRQALPVREAIFAPQELIAAERALGRICAAPTVACPPAIPIAVSGEVITQEALQLFRYYQVDSVAVVKE